MSGKKTKRPETEREKAGKKQCQKRDGTINVSRRTGEPCNCHPSRGLPFCYHHGGKSKRGTAHGRYKDGRYTDVANLPEYLQSYYAQAYDDEALFEFREDAAMTKARIWNMIGTMGETDLPWVWRKLKSLKAIGEKQLHQDDEDGFADTIKEIFGLLDAGASETDKWLEVERLQKHRMKIASAERSRKKDDQLMISVEQMAIERDRLLHAFVTVIKRIIPRDESHTLIGLIEDEYQTEISRGGRPGA